MKTLVISNRNDFRLYSLIAAMQTIMPVGFLRSYDKQSVDSYGADIIFADEIHHFQNCYDLSNLSRLNPFVNLDSYSNPVDDPKYVSDISYLGNITDFDSALPILFQLGYNVRNFNPQPSGLACYSGSVGVAECWNIYRNAKVSPIPSNDVGYRELDIILAGGNPLKFISKDEFIREAVNGIRGKKFPHSIDRSSIIEHNTNYDRLSQIVADMGFREVSEKIMKAKSDRNISI